jgi:hypothetical protein
MGAAIRDPVDSIARILIARVTSKHPNPRMLELALNRWEKGKHPKHPTIRLFLETNERRPGAVPRWAAIP